MYKACKTGFTRKSVPSTLNLQDGTATSTELETANALLQKFLPDDSPVIDEEQHKRIRNLLKRGETPNSQPEPEFTKHEVDEVINQINENKSPGPDGIDGTIVKRLHEILPTFWESIFNKCLLLGCFPAEWKQAKIVVIPKSDKTKAHSVAGYRGISLLAIPGKCLEKLLVGRLNYFLNINAHIHPQQYGFTEGRYTVDAIKVVVEFVRHNKQLGLKS